VQAKVGGSRRGGGIAPVQGGTGRTRESGGFPSTEGLYPVSDRPEEWSSEMVFLN
jgi:hypothetical protein